MTILIKMKWGIFMASLEGAGKSAGSNTMRPDFSVGKETLQTFFDNGNVTEDKRPKLIAAIKSALEVETVDLNKIIVTKYEGGDKNKSAESVTIKDQGKSLTFRLEGGGFFSSKTYKQVYKIDELIAAMEDNKDLEEIEKIVAGIADVNQAMSNGATPLFIAAQNGHTETAKLLLEKRADVNQAMSNGATPLYIAAQNDHRETVQLLITERADVNQAMSNGATPLYIAAQSGHTETVQLLITKMQM